MQNCCYLTHKFKRTHPNDKKVETKQNNLISINEKEHKDNIVDDWLVERLKNRLKKIVTIVGTQNRPLVLYSGIIDESEDSATEEIVLHSQKYITIQIFTRGGFLPTSFHEQHVFTIDKFISWIVKERKDREMISQCLAALDDSL
jgi:tRNA nucleotidyltransferase (CCA-adding enzyme)